MRPFPVSRLIRFAALLCLMLGTVPEVFAQQPENEVLEDVVYLRSGSVVRGRIVSYVQDQYVKIEILGGSVFVYPMSEVERMTREPAKDPWWIDYYALARANNRTLRPIQYRDRGIYHGFASGLAFGQNRWGPAANFQIQYRGGFRFSPHLSTGIVLGLDPYPEGVLMIPLMLEVHGDAAKRRRTTMHYLAQAGYGAFSGSLPWNFTELRGGPVFHLGFGPKFHTRGRSELAFTVGYKAQRSYQEYQDFNGGGWDPVTGQPIPLQIRGSRTYQRTVWQMTVFF
ncbi:MAG: hypothetical protein NW241_01625 [Bacteroidia bacterium]|nr:hypothetical protein [Bacteroidia bacterium]